MNQKAEWFTINPDTSLPLSLNTKSFKKRFPHAAEIVRSSVERLHQYEFLLVNDEQYACRQKIDHQYIDLYAVSWFQSGLEPSFRRIQELMERNMEMLLIAGSGLGYFNADIAQSNAAQKKVSVVCIENRPELMLAQLCLFDCRKTIEDADFHWVIGEPVLPQLDDLFQKEALFTINRNNIVSMPERILTPDERTFYAPLNHWFAERQQTYFIQQNQYQIRYDCRIKNSPDLKTGTVWTASMLDAYAHAPLQRSLVNGFAAHGMNPVFLPLSTGKTADECIKQSLVEHCPDLYLFLHIASKRVIPENINRPRITWYLDHPKHYEWSDNSSNFYENDFIFYSDRQYASYFENTKASGSYHLTVCPSLNRDGVCRPEMDAPVMFVGSHIPVETMTQKLSGKLKEYLFQIADELLLHPAESVTGLAKKMQITNDYVQIFLLMAEQFIAAIQRKFPTTNDRLEYFFYAFTNSYKRERYIKALMKHGLVIYGPDSWLDVLGEQHKNQFRGWLGFDDLADAYASAKVCVNIHSLQCPTCLNSRDLDVLRAGGCLVSDEVEDMHGGYLLPDHDVMIYRTPEELADSVSILLKDESKRRNLMEHGHRTVMERHLPQHRAQEILNTIQSSGWRGNS